MLSLKLVRLRYVWLQLLVRYFHSPSQIVEQMRNTLFLNWPRYQQLYLASSRFQPRIYLVTIYCQAYRSERWFTCDTDYFLQSHQRGKVTAHSSTIWSDSWAVVVPKFRESYFFNPHPPETKKLTHMPKTGTKRPTLKHKCINIILIYIKI